MGGLNRKSLEIAIWTHANSKITNKKTNNWYLKKKKNQCITLEIILIILKPKELWNSEKGK